MTTAQSSAVKPEAALWAVYLGGDVAPGRMDEDHAITLIPAEPGDATELDGTYKA